MLSYKLDNNFCIVKEAKKFLQEFGETPQIMYFVSKSSLAPGVYYLNIGDFFFPMTLQSDTLTCKFASQFIDDGTVPFQIVGHLDDGSTIKSNIEYLGVNPCLCPSNPPAKKRLLDEWLEQIEDLIRNASKQSEDPRANLQRTSLDYVYKLETSNYIDFKKTNNFLDKKLGPAPAPGCTAWLNGSKHYRNFDWTYDYECIFMVHQKACNDYLEFIGTASAQRELVKSFVESGQPNELYNHMASLIVDGMNSAGLSVQCNVVTMEDGETPINQDRGKDRLCTTQIASYILSHCRTLAEVEPLIANVDIWLPDKFTENFSVHFFIADKEGNAKVMEFVNNEVVYTNVTDRPIMTNFLIYGTELKDGHLDLDTLKDFSDGVERYELLLSNDCALVNEDLRYSQLYTITDPDLCWYSELVGHYPNITITIRTPREQIMPYLEYMRQMYAETSRDKADCWISTYSVCFDKETLEGTWYANEDFEHSEKMSISFPIY